MGSAELNGQYQRLRTELDAAYTAPVWNSSRIDQITEQMVQVERALASAEHSGSHAGASLRHGAAEGASDTAARAGA